MVRETRAMVVDKEDEDGGGEGFVEVEKTAEMKQKVPKGGPSEGWPDKASPI
jgi:hypothetical protein